MEPLQQESSASQTKAPHERSLTFILMGRRGKVRTFQVSRPLLVWASLFFAAFIVFSIISINGYLWLKEENDILLDRLELLERQVEKGSQSLQKSRKQVFFLEEYIRLAEERSGTVAPAGSPPAQGKRSEQAVKNPSSPKSPGDWVQVKDVLLERERARLSISFRLARTEPDDHPLGGYVHVIAENNQADPPRFWVYPDQTLVNGLPENFRRGHFFSIARYKLIRGKIPVRSDSPYPLAVKVVIYDEAGSLIKESLFEVPQES